MLTYRVVVVEPLPIVECEHLPMCGVELGNGMRCLRRRDHNGLHETITDDGRVFEWG